MIMASSASNIHTLTGLSLSLCNYKLKACVMQTQDFATIPQATGDCQRKI